MKNLLFPSAGGGDQTWSLKTNSDHYVALQLLDLQVLDHVTTAGVSK